MSRFSKCVAVSAATGTLVVVGMLCALNGGARRPVAGNLTEVFFRELRATRRQREAQVIAYFDAARKLTDGILEDRLMMGTFRALRTRGAPPDAQTDFALDLHFVNKYGGFYDILFVDTSGYVFHSVRRESDYGSNLFEGPLANTKLARRLPAVRELTFIDYDRYPPSDEPAAFFAVPVLGPELTGRASADSEREGWFVLQCPLNKLNSILSDRRGLGRTGEVYLVNTEQRMVPNRVSEGTRRTSN